MNFGCRGALHSCTKPEFTPRWTSPEIAARPPSGLRPAAVPLRMQTEATPPDPYATGSAVVEAQIELDIGGTDNGPCAGETQHGIATYDGRWRGVSLRTTAGEGRHLALHATSRQAPSCARRPRTRSRPSRSTRSGCAQAAHRRGGSPEHRCAACDQVYYCNDRAARRTLRTAPPARCRTRSPAWCSRRWDRCVAARACKPCSGW